MEKILNDRIKVFAKVSAPVFLALKASGHFQQDFDEWFEGLLVKALQTEGFIEKPKRKKKTEEVEEK